MSLDISFENGMSVLPKTLFVILAYISKHDLDGEFVLFPFFTEIILRKRRFKCVHSGVKAIVKTSFITEVRLGVNRRLRGHGRPAAEIMLASSTSIDRGWVRGFHGRYIEMPSDECRMGNGAVGRLVLLFLSTRCLSELSRSSPRAAFMVVKSQSSSGTLS